MCGCVRRHFHGNRGREGITRGKGGGDPKRETARAVDISAGPEIEAFCSSYRAVAVWQGEGGGGRRRNGQNFALRGIFGSLSDGANREAACDVEGYSVKWQRRRPEKPLMTEIVYTPHPPFHSLYARLPRRWPRCLSYLNGARHLVRGTS